MCESSAVGSHSTFVGVFSRPGIGSRHPVFNGSRAEHRKVTLALYHHYSPKIATIISKRLALHHTIRYSVVQSPSSRTRTSATGLSSNDWTQTRHGVSTTYASSRLILWNQMLVSTCSPNDISFPYQSRRTVLSLVALNCYCTNARTVVRQLWAAPRYRSTAFGEWQHRLLCGCLIIDSQQGFRGMCLGGWYRFKSLFRRHITGS